MLVVNILVIIFCRFFWGKDIKKVLASDFQKKINNSHKLNTVQDVQMKLGTHVARDYTVQPVFKDHP